MVDQVIRHRRLRPLIGSLGVAVAVCLVGGGRDAQPAGTSDSITISMIAEAMYQPGYSVLIPNFERVYPNIKVDITYAASTAQDYQIETTELAAGNGPDLLATFPGCGTPISVCTLAKAGFLAPMIDAPWLKRSLRLVTSLDKNGQELFAFSPLVSPYGVFTNDDKFAQLGLNVPQTFSQLLGICQRARAAGTTAIIVGGQSPTVVSRLIADLAVATVYANDPHWGGERRAGKVTFEGSAGWQQALQEFVQMNTAGCFEDGFAGTSAPSAEAQFAEGQGLMYAGLTTDKGTIDAGNPPFTYSHHPFPGGTTPDQTRTFVHLSGSVSVNAHASAQAQAAAQTFVDFLARPEQNALYAKISGGLTQYEFMKRQLPAFMSDESPVLVDHAYVVNPIESWWNPNVLLALQNGIGLVTGQLSINGILDAMDAAWNQGPA